MGIGETFKQVRKERGLSLEEIAEKTKIRRRYLEAIEEENFGLLPGRVYVKGFLRNYAKFLGLNPEPLVALYEERYPGEQPAAVAAEVPPKKEKIVHSRRKPLIYVFLAAVLCLAAFGLYAWQAGALFSQAPDDVRAPGNADGRDLPGQVYAPPDQPASPPVSPVLEDNAPPRGVSLVLDVVQDSCWMRVVVDGETKFEGELTARQSRSFSGKERIKVKLGNAGAVQVQVNGRNLGYLGGRGEVVNKEFVAASDG
ncbi:MAG: RodZ domain-containing protein [Bacillota bacterium]